MKIKKIVMSLSVLAAACSVSYADTKLATVNPVEIFNDSNLGSVSVKKLENDFKPQIDKLKEQQNNIIQAAQTLQKNSATITKDELSQKRQELQQQQADFSKQVKILEQKEYAEKDKLSKQFQSAFNSAVKTIAKKDGYNMIFTTQAIAYSDGVDDISSDVVELMNKNS